MPSFAQHTRPTAAPPCRRRFARKRKRRHEGAAGKLVLHGASEMRLEVRDFVGRRERRAKRSFEPALSSILFVEVEHEPRTLRKTECCTQIAPTLTQKYIATPVAVIGLRHERLPCNNSVRECNKTFAEGKEASGTRKQFFDSIRNGRVR